MTTTTINRETLVTALGRVAATCGDPRRFPIVGCALFAGTSISTTDMETFTTVETGVVLPSLAVDCRRLLGIVRAMEGDDVTLEVGASSVVVTGGRARYSVATLDAADFPALPVVPALSAVDTASTGPLGLAGRIDCDRYGVLLDWWDGTLAVAATDGYRLMLAGQHGDNAVAISGRSVGVLGDMNITHAGASDDWAFFADGTSVVGVRRVRNGSYPDVGGVLKTARANATGTAHVDGGRLLGALRRVQLMAGESSRVELKLRGGVLQLSARDVAAGDAADAVPYEGDATIETAVNGRYLGDFAKQAAGGHVAITVNGGPGSALLFTASDVPSLDGAAYVLMPMTK